MLIDWFTVVAQVINFLILVYLLKRFLYKPILHAIDEREKLVAQRLEKAQQKEDEAKVLSEDLKNKIKEFNDTSISRNNELTQKIEAHGKQLKNAAKEEALRAAQKWHQKMQDEATQLQQEIINQVCSQVIALTKKTLQDLAGVELESHIVIIFLKKINELSGEKKEELKSFVKNSKKSLVLSSAFELSTSQTQAIQHALDQCLEVETVFKHELHPQIMSGIELLVDGQKLMWSIESYLSSIEEGVHKVLQEKVQVGTS